MNKSREELEECYTSVYNYFQWKVFEKNNVPDLTGKTMYKVCKNYKSGNLLGYAHIAAKNVLIDYIRKNKLHTDSINTTLDDESNVTNPHINIADHYLNPIEEIVNTELGEAISEAMDSLRFIDKHIVKQYLIKGYKTREIAEELDMNENSVKASVMKSRIILRDKLQDIYNTYREEFV